MYIPRVLYTSLLSQQSSVKASILIGPRQVGKTTLLKQLHQALGGVFIDVDLFSQYEQVATYENLLNTLRLRGFNPQQTNPFFIFLDEFHRYPELAMVIKNVVDHHTNIKIYATGSSSLDIRQSIQESLAGRKHLNYIYPLSFGEYLLFQQRSDLVAHIQRLPELESTNWSVLVPELRPYLDQFLVYGGYPEVALTEEASRPEVLRDIFDLYLRKDLASYIQPDKMRSAKALIQLLAINHGQQTNYDSYGSQASLDVKTVKHYLFLLQASFLIVLLRPYFTNKNKEISKMPKAYFLDNGVRNYFYQNFNVLQIRNDAGSLFESFYLAELIKKGIDPEQIKYYRSKMGHEVDIVIDQGSSLTPIELKFRQKITTHDWSGLRHFLETYHLPKGYICSLGPLKQAGLVEWISPFSVPEEVFNRSVH